MLKRSIHFNMPWKEAATYTEPPYHRRNTDRATQTYVTFRRMGEFEYPSASLNLYEELAMNTWDDTVSTAFDDDFADGFIGKYLLVGITRTSHSGQILSQQQLHGIILTATSEAIELELEGVNAGKIWRMPPMLEDLAPAKAGRYELKTTGEVVDDPDFTYTLTLCKTLH